MGNWIRYVFESANLRPSARWTLFDDELSLKVPEKEEDEDFSYWAQQQPQAVKGANKRISEPAMMSQYGKRLCMKKAKTATIQIILSERIKSKESENHQ